jgi:hypothetical protein
MKTGGEKQVTSFKDEQKLRGEQEKGLWAYRVACEKAERQRERSIHRAAYSPSFLKEKNYIAEVVSEMSF